jgi:hypothetical protein
MIKSLRGSRSTCSDYFIGKSGRRSNLTGVALLIGLLLPFCERDRNDGNNYFLVSLLSLQQSGKIVNLIRSSTRNFSNQRLNTALSSNGLGRRPLKAVIRVRFPLALLLSYSNTYCLIFSISDCYTEIVFNIY